jgi:tRNA dimethylallyltransferase
MKSKILFLVGPTATGKTNLAIQIAIQSDAEIINADSVQVYEGLDIGSAKPTPQELKTVPHHLIGYIQKGKDYTSGQFRKDVFNLIEKYPKKNFIIVGGSGFYLKALTTGLYEIPKVPKEIHLEVKEESNAKLYRELQKVDPESAKIINPNDSYRLQRAMEVYRAFHKPLSFFKNEFIKQDLPFEHKKIGLKLEREELRSRIRLRVLKMLEDGLVSEVELLLKENLENWKALSSVGYKEVVQMLKGELDPNLLVDEIVKNTMGLAKRQMTWFRKDEEIQWFHALNEIPEALVFGVKYFQKT